MARRHVHGRHDLCGGHAAGGDGTGRANGIAGNWLWWNFVFGGMLTVFFLRPFSGAARASSPTSSSLELRYSGGPAAFLRGFRALYLGLFINTVIIGWVNRPWPPFSRGCSASPGATSWCTWRLPWGSRRSTRPSRASGA